MQCKINKCMMDGVGCHMPERDHEGARATARGGSWDSGLWTHVRRVTRMTATTASKHTQTRCRTIFSVFALCSFETTQNDEEQMTG